MKIVVIGATGTVGKAVVAALEGRHQVLRVGHHQGDDQVDITSAESVRALFERVGQVDAIVVTSGELYFGPLGETTPEQFRKGIDSKLMGQVNVALIGQHYLRRGGSITLTSGIVADEPIAQGFNATTVNAAVEGFARAVAVDAWGAFRINVVSPTLLTESQEAYGPFFPGFVSQPADTVAQAYVRSVEGPQTGRIYPVF
ncbi:NAD(P)-dependent dehydrogenase (short-subunit alcohol dehydrogenase family) [Silvimonas terrae]|uniref:NAD(P)-dependent dehydrogenase (Short-subunit alcohol dehydrogenase family) n=1 Tax=Silvimonas terrae TaxID=300266 RepID=A0A840RIW1_9NEIS|nr:short chain dehydrogenase [Silvimonas terrae]MBB5192524.1 NAD(P)-dependent dehydrogenase (short-subunit alcohol dehydrogenase family) [Silvimonas terrae]